jgi:hypothetical protein
VVSKVSSIVYLNVNSYGLQWYGVATMGLSWWSSTIAVLIIIGHGSIRHVEGFVYKLTPNWKDLLMGVSSFIAISVLIGPLCFLLGYFKLTANQGITILDVVSLFVMVGLILNGSHII